MSDDFKQTKARVISPCPSCGGKVPETSVWIYQGKFFCSEPCARKGAGLGER